MRRNRGGTEEELRRNRLLTPKFSNTFAILAGTPKISTHFRPLSTSGRSIASSLFTPYLWMATMSLKKTKGEKKLTHKKHGKLKVMTKLLRMEFKRISEKKPTHWSAFRDQIKEKNRKGMDSHL